jgi:hypothetical protein
MVTRPPVRCDDRHPLAPISSAIRRAPRAFHARSVQIRARPPCNRTNRLHDGGVDRRRALEQHARAQPRERCAGRRHARFRGDDPERGREPVHTHPNVGRIQRDGCGFRVCARVERADSERSIRRAPRHHRARQRSTRRGLGHDRGASGACPARRPTRRRECARDQRRPQREQREHRDEHDTRARPTSALRARAHVTARPDATAPRRRNPDVRCRRWRIARPTTR